MIAIWDYNEMFCLINIDLTVFTANLLLTINCLQCTTDNALLKYSIEMLC